MSCERSRAACVAYSHGRPRWASGVVLSKTGDRDAFDSRSHRLPAGAGCVTRSRPAAPAQRRSHLRRRSRLRRRVVVRRDAGEDAATSIAWRARASASPDAHCAAATCTPSRYAHAHRRVRVAAAGHRRAARQRGAHHRAWPPDTARMFQAGRLRHRRGRASGTSASGLRAGRLERRDSPRARSTSVSTTAFIMAATGDRVPTVYVENRRVVKLDPNDPIGVSYGTPLGDWPTGRGEPEPAQDCIRATATTRPSSTASAGSAT